jgi:hypothetical protein
MEGPVTSYRKCLAHGKKEGSVKQVENDIEENVLQTELQLF